MFCLLNLKNYLQDQKMEISRIPIQCWSLSSIPVWYANLMLLNKWETFLGSLG